jgi:hypothetical protein
VAVTPLSTVQQGTVDELVAERRLERVPVDERRCAAFLEQADTALADLPNVRHAQNKYNLAYDAAHDVGQHDSLGRFLAAVLDTPPENAASRHYDRMRRERNRQRYNAQPIMIAAATAAAEAATLLYRAGRDRFHPMH